MNDKIDADFKESAEKKTANQPSSEGDSKQGSYEQQGEYKRRDSYSDRGGSSDRPPRRDGPPRGDRPFRDRNSGFGGRSGGFSSDRPRRSFSSDRPRPSFGDRGGRGFSSDRPSRDGGSFNRPSYGPREGAPENAGNRDGASAYGERERGFSRDRSSGGREGGSFSSDGGAGRGFPSDRPRRSFSNDRPRPSFGDRGRSSFGDRGGSRGFSSDRPPREGGSYEQRPSYPRRDSGGFGGGRPPREGNSFGNRSFSGDRGGGRSFSSDRPRPSFGDRGRSSFGDRSSYGDRNRSSYGDRQRYEFVDGKAEAKFEAPEQVILPENQEYIYGLNPVRLAIAAKRRKFYELFINEEKDFEQEPYKAIIDLATAEEITITKKTKEELNALLPDTQHQSVILHVSFLPIIDLKKLLKNPYLKKVIALDQVQDPQNLGAIIRSATYFGADAIIYTADKSAPVNATVSKTSAGLLESMTMVEVTNMAQSIAEMKENGFWTVGTAVEGTSLFDFEVPEKMLIVFGNEHKGIRQLVSSKCDWVLSIPGVNSAESLNVSVAAGIFLAVFNSKVVS